MSVQMQEMLNFHLTGKRDGATAGDPVIGTCPALLVPYRQLEALRYDFPLILLDSADSQAFVDSLTAIVNRLLREIAPEGSAGTLLRQHVLRLETRMRELAAGAEEISLEDLWTRAEQSLLAESDERGAELLGNSIATARFALRVKGTVVGCTDRLPARLLRHAWAKLEAQRTRVSAGRIETLIIKLRDILKVDDLKNDSSRSPQKLKMTFGRRYREAFDFELMSEILGGTTLQNRLPDDRRERIGDALSVLEEQKFFALFGAAQDRKHYDFEFDSLSTALRSYNERLQGMAEVVKAIEVAELEIGNTFRDDRHAAYFERFGIQSLAPEDLAMFPSYLVCLHENECNTRDSARLMEIVSRELPMKILVHVSDALGEPSRVDGSPHSGSYVQQLAQTFIAGNAFVLQSAASNLYRRSESLRRGLAFDGPAVFSVYVPFDDAAATLPAYLLAAAAMESRVFPSFSYDPSAGAGLARRFDIGSNPDVDEDWPRRDLRYEDGALQTVAEDYRFTLADFAVMERPYANHFAVVAKDSWNDDMVPMAEYLEQPSADSVDKVPYVAVVDGDNRLRRMIVDDSLVRMVRRCRDRWHALQELGGVHNSYAEAARNEARADVPAAERAVEPVRDTRESARADVEAEVVEPVADTDTGDTGAGPDAAIDEPWIETPRCTTCDECTRRNPRMFAYDDNKQAYIKDPDAGTFLDLVEAAETCQVAIIHPGKPRNPNEPGLAELVERAAPFNS